ncbi:DNA cytosine methyltransferase [Paenochrobactrum glaciei]|uniref:Cytosine-specific methyltransferase n=1 Tax=Paenochrobactrum glaciei TaxID=486407 RepID=A0ABP3RJ21_9HYPH
MRKYKVVSMFSGCGGMDLGFLGGFNSLGVAYKKRPFEIIWANDLNAYACATYKHNLQHNIHIGNIWDHIDSMPSTCDVLIGGFPCQDISINGKRAGVAGARSGLYRAMVEAVDNMKPKMFIAENVRGLLFKYNKDSLEKVISDFSSLGYKVSYRLYNAANFGIPQGRERVLIVGVLDDVIEFDPPKETFTKDQWISSKSAIDDLCQLDIDPEFSHIWSLAAKTTDQGARVLDPNKPAPTVRAECHGNNPFHYSLPRRVSMRESARFQSFPDSFIFKARLRETERMIGNAVPPVLAWHLSGAVETTLSKIEAALKDKEDNSPFNAIAAE